MLYESVRGTKALGLVKEQCVLEVIVVFMDVLFVTFHLKTNTRPLRCCSLSYNKYPCDPLSVRVNWYVLTQEQIQRKYRLLL